MEEAEIGSMSDVLRKLEAINIVRNDHQDEFVKNYGLFGFGAHDIVRPPEKTGDESKWSAAAAHAECLVNTLTHSDTLAQVIGAPTKEARDLVSASAKACAALVVGDKLGRTEGYSAAKTTETLCAASFLFRALRLLTVEIVRHKCTNDPNSAFADVFTAKRVGVTNAADRSVKCKLCVVNAAQSTVMDSSNSSVSHTPICGACQKMVMMWCAVRDFSDVISKCKSRGRDNYAVVVATGLLRLYAAVVAPPFSADLRTIGQAFALARSGKFEQLIVSPIAFPKLFALGRPLDELSSSEDPSPEACPDLDDGDAAACMVDDANIDEFMRDDDEPGDNDDYDDDNAKSSTRWKHTDIDDDELDAFMEDCFEDPSDDKIITHTPNDIEDITEYEVHSDHDESTVYEDIWGYSSDESDSDEAAHPVRVLPMKRVGEVHAQPKRPRHNATT